VRSTPYNLKAARSVLWMCVGVLRGNRAIETGGAACGTSKKLLMKLDFCFGVSE